MGKSMMTPSLEGYDSNTLDYLQQRCDSWGMSQGLTLIQTLRYHIMKPRNVLNLNYHYTEFTQEENRANG